MSNGTPGISPTGNGVMINFATTGNTIGGTTTAEGNIVSGNDAIGVQIAGTGTGGNLVEGNYIGPDVSGSKASPTVRSERILAGKESL